MTLTYRNHRKITAENNTVVATEDSKNTRGPASVCRQQEDAVLPCPSCVDREMNSLCVKERERETRQQRRTAELYLSQRLSTVQRSAGWNEFIA